MAIHQQTTKQALRRMAEILVQAYIAQGGKVTKCDSAVAQGACNSGNQIPHLGNRAVGVHRAAC